MTGCLKNSGNGNSRSESSSRSRSSKFSISLHAYSSNLAISGYGKCSPYVQVSALGGPGTPSDSVPQPFHVKAASMYDLSMPILVSFQLLALSTCTIHCSFCQED